MLTESETSITRAELEVALGFYSKDQYPDPNTLPKFQRRAFKVVETACDDLSRREIWENFRRTLPLVKILTEPRKIDEFQEFREEMLRVLEEEDYELHDPLQFLEFLSWDLKILSPEGSFDTLHTSCAELDSEEALKQWRESGIRREHKDPGDKHVSLAEVRKETGLRGHYQRLGMTFGKWRAGFHDEHIDLLNQARDVLGPDGIYVVVIEGKNTIRERLGKDIFCLDDEVRINQAASQQAVDMVCLVDVQTADGTKLDESFAKIWSDIDPDYYFLGAHSDPLAERFVQRGHVNGTIVLWARESNSTSTSEIIQEIRNGNYS